MAIRKDAIHDLIHDLTSSLNDDLAAPLGRRVRHALALLHATVESLEEIDRFGLPVARPAGSRAVPQERWRSS
jgi:hypothetical protein